MSVRETLLCVMTCRRPQGVSYLARTVSLLDAAGADLCRHRLVISDGPAPEECTWSIVEHAGPKGTRTNMWRAFDLAYAAGVERLIYIEDDALPCQGAIARILSLEVPADLAFLSFYDGSMISAGAPDGIHRVTTRGPDGTGFWGALAMYMPRRTIEYCLRHDPGGFAPHWGQIRMGSDSSLGLHLAAGPWPSYGIHVPTLFDHVGDVSAAHPGDTLREHRVARNFRGQAFDALSLGRGAPWL